MLIFGYAGTLLFLSLAGKGNTSPIVQFEGLRYEEYVVEHEISETQAKNTVLSIDLNNVKPPPGCHNCTASEIRYCLGPDLVNDHCCCDRRYTEFLPFIPHTCYAGPVTCQPIIGDCAEYNRLRVCCCEKHAIKKWKKRSAGAIFYLNKCVLTLVFIFYYLYYIVL